MDFGTEPKPDFEKVDRRYAHLRHLHETGGLTGQEFDTMLKRSMVQDQTGRWWTKSRKSGEWHYHDVSAWVKGNPPRYR